MGPYVESRPDLLERANVLQAYCHTSRVTEEAVIPHAKRFLLDSGAFTYMTTLKGAEMDWDAYVDRYAEFIKRNPRIDGFFELDLDSIIGYERVLGLRERLESGAGRRCIPVWHRSRGRDEFIRMCEEYDRVAVGGIVTREIPRRDYPVLGWLIRTAHEHGARIHGLGFTAFSLLPRYRFDSVDSSSWTAGSRYGKVFRFNGRTMTAIDAGADRRVNPRATSIYNFAEWVRFSEYAEEML